MNPLLGAAAFTAGLFGKRIPLTSYPTQLTSAPPQLTPRRSLASPMPRRERQPEPSGAARYYSQQLDPSEARELLQLSAANAGHARQFFLIRKAQEKLWPLHPSVLEDDLPTLRSRR